MLILEAQIGMGFDWETRYYAPENVKLGTTDGQYLIVMDQRDTQSGKKRPWEKNIPDEHAHVIYLPHDYAQIVRQTAMQRGGSAEDLRNTLQQR